MASVNDAPYADASFTIAHYTLRKFQVSYCSSLSFFLLSSAAFDVARIEVVRVGVQITFTTTPTAISSVTGTLEGTITAIYTYGKGVFGTADIVVSQAHWMWFYESADASSISSNQLTTL